MREPKAGGRLDLQLRDSEQREVLQRMRAAQAVTASAKRSWCDSISERSCRGSIGEKALSMRASVKGPAGDSISKKVLS